MGWLFCAVEVEDVVPFLYEGVIPGVLDCRIWDMYFKHECGRFSSLYSLVFIFDRRLANLRGRAVAASHVVTVSHVERETKSALIKTANAGATWYLRILSCSSESIGSECIQQHKKLLNCVMWILLMDRVLGAPVGYQLWIWHS